MSDATATIRELRTNFKAVKRKIEQHGKVTITDNGVPSYTITAAPPVQMQKRPPLPNYYARLLKRRPKPLTAEQARALHEENRGER
jgi:antitoxin (DNA-binding transcriptional repressor) of toxin-antitoxin stability system